ncbi:hypothetical protein NV379_14875 [Paenibacillus sp. N1-5-1-14]|uniref:hypothetical protein n=1 Tax=Paenibacillus radicibacter TaxID=2972488 RepID=UPI002158BB31|nr:hypothetical protein [Paenibacillus radicibacter]MCR8643936.1 hypothetical protein [Paenibacillus radicibacter]
MSNYKLRRAVMALGISVSLLTAQLAFGQVNRIYAQSAPNNPTINRDQPPVVTDQVIPVDQSELHDKITDWKKRLASQPGWESWKQASWSVYPLGPGTHGWIVELTSNDQKVGYMIVSGDMQGGYVLTEYGKGPNPLFSLETLHRVLTDREIIAATLSINELVHSTSIKINRIYVNALQALWEIVINGHKTYYDAVTGALVELDKAPTLSLPEQGLTPIGLTDKLPKVDQRAPFDPYERMPWLTGKPLTISNFVNFENAFQSSSELRLVCELFNGQLSMPLPVIGYVQWDQSEPLIIVDQEGERYIPLTTALQTGKLYS